MKNNKTIIGLLISTLLLIAVIVVSSVFTSKTTDNNQDAAKQNGSNPLLDMIKGKGEPKLEIIEDIDMLRNDINGKPMKDNDLLWAEKDYREEDGKSIWTYTHKGVVGELVSSDKKDIDEFSYTFDIDIENKIARGDMLNAVGYFNSSLEEVYKIEDLDYLNSKKYTNLDSIDWNYEKDLITEPETKFTLNGLSKVDGQKQTWNCVFKYNKNSLLKQVAESSGEDISDEKLKEASQETIRCVVGK